MNCFRKIFRFDIGLLFLLLILTSYVSVKANAVDGEILLRQENYSVKIIKKGFRYSILKPNGESILDAISTSGIELLRSPVVRTELLSQDDHSAEFKVVNDVGVSALVRFYFFDHYFKMSIQFDGNNHSITGAIVAQTRGHVSAFGLADHAAFKEPYSTNVYGYKSTYFGALSDGHPSRLVSNFVIFPEQGVACINIEPHKKIIKITKNKLAQGTYYTHSMPAMYYFIGTPKQIYSDYLKVRDKEGYKVYKPKYEWFGVGWEAFGALGWHTNHETVRKDIDHYLRLGFPLSWMVVGSGFWPGDDPKYFSTTSFGYWDKDKYPNPKEFIDYFHKKGLKFIIGLRIAFIPNGPYTNEGIEKGYFIKRNDEARLFKIGFPKPDCYFLDASNPDAVKWYIHLCEKWGAIGVDGYKEDIFTYDINGLPDNKLNGVNEALMDKGVYVMGRNNYVGSAMDLQRFEDFNYNQNQDRGPVNGLAYAYSGFPFIYPDIIGGTGLTNIRYGKIPQNTLAKYLMREAQYASLNPSMSFGYAPWNLKNPEVLKVCLKAAHLHDRLHDYIYSSAIRSYETGFPYTMTPLPLAYPNDKATYNRENDKVHGYQWMIGDALMAIPLYGNDYAQSDTRDIYLPEGKWIDYDNGEVYQGPTTLKKFAIPFDKTPLFVGGTGFVIEKVNGKLYGRVYPIAFDGETVFYDKDGKENSNVSIHRITKKVNKVMDRTTGRKVKIQYNRLAYEFPFIPGHDYDIE